MHARLPGACLAGVFAALLCVACAEAPDKPIAAARAGLQEARAAGAERYAADALSAASAALLDAEQAASRRDYARATERADESLERSREAGRLAHERKAAAQGDAGQAIHELEAAIDAARGRVMAADAAAAPLARAQRLALSDTRRAIVVGNVSLQKARTLFAGGDYAQAREAAQDGVTRLQSAGSPKQASSPSPVAAPRR